jgi:hypothetical protein
MFKYSKDIKFVSAEEKAHEIAFKLAYIPDDIKDIVGLLNSEQNPNECDAIAADHRTEP